MAAPVVKPGSETVIFAFAKMDFEYKPQKPDGSLDAGIHFKYDLKTNKDMLGPASAREGRRTVGQTMEQSETPRAS